MPPCSTYLHKKSSKSYRATESASSTEEWEQESPRNEGGMSSVKREVSGRSITKRRSGSEAVVWEAEEMLMCTTEIYHRDRGWRVVVVMLMDLSGSGQFRNCS